jgi:hypothetical protein
MPESVPAKLCFQFPAPEPLVSDTCAELLVPSTVAFQGDAGSQKPNLLVGDKGTVLSTGERFAD